MKILVVYDAATRQIHRLVGNPFPADVSSHVGDGEAHYVAATLEPDPKTIEQLQAEVDAHVAQGGAA